jgi:hypothetical protein
MEVEGKNLDGQEIQGKKKDASLSPWRKCEIMDLQKLTTFIASIDGWLLEQQVL